MPTELVEVAEEGPCRDKKDDDLFCLVKQFMADDVLSQPPLRVMPAYLKRSAVASLRGAKDAGLCTVWVATQSNILGVYIAALHHVRSSTAWLST
jgi:hypothetical protein